MYITHNNQTYERVRMLNTSSSVRFVGESLPELEELTGMIMVFSESGFELRTFDPTDYLRQEISIGSWLFINTPKPVQPEPQVLSPRERRELTYETEPLIAYESEQITVDEANKLFLQYAAEGNNSKCSQLQQLIHEAKTTIRNTYPDDKEA